MMISVLLNNAVDSVHRPLLISDVDGVRQLYEVL